MSFIPIPNSIKASIEFGFGSQLIVLTLGWKKATAVEHADLDALNTALTDWWDTHLSQVISHELNAFQVTSTDQSSESGESVAQAIYPNIPGVQASDALPSNVAAVVTFRSPLRGRSYRGRAYVCGLPKTWQDSPTTITSGALVDLLTPFTQLSDVETATGLTHAVLSRFHNGAPRTTGVATPIETYTGNTALDSQRRRLAGRGI